MKKIKDKKINEYNIKVYTIRELHKEGSGYSWKNTFWVFQIRKPSINYWKYSTTRGGFKSQREMFDAIEKELYINRFGIKELIRRKLNKWLR